MNTSHALRLLLVAAIFIASCKKSDNPSTSSTDVNPAPTPVGTAVGAPSSATIDASGGTLMSPDGRLEVIIPANALSAATPISIQQVTNETPGGAGVGFSLLPNGQQFSKPVTLRFHYGAADLAGTNIHALAVATQKDDGIWYEFNTSSLDSVSGTLSTTTTHFSAYSLLSSFRIVPDYAEIKVNESKSVEVRVAQKATDSDPNDDLAPLGTFVTYQNPSQVKWTLNGSSIGNLDDGTFSPSTGSSTTYTAPAAVDGMSSNPVTLTAEVDLPGTSKIYLLSNIKVSNGASRSYKISMDFKGTGMVDVVDVLHGYTQHASFIATVYPDRDTVVYSDITNEPGQVTDWKERYVTCKHEATSQGDLMHITGFYSEFFDRFAQPSRIYPHVHTSLTGISYTTDCGSGAKTTTGTKYEPVDYAPGAVFVLDGTTQSYTDPTSGNVLYGAVVTFTLTPQ